METYLIRCAEIGRELQVRHGKLRRDLASVVGDRLPDASVELAPGRLIVQSDRPNAAEVLASLPGVGSVSPCRRVGFADLVKTVVEMARALIEPGASFAIRVRRGGERGGAAANERTPDIARRLADAIAHATGARSDLTRPDVEIGVDLRGDEAFVFDRVIHGVDRTGPTVPRADGEARFVADQMLGRLAARLRLLGYDTLTVYDLADSEVTRLAAAEGRILLTRDTALSRTRAVPVHRVVATTPRAQLTEVLTALSLTPDPSRYFTRCTLCNEPVEPVTEAMVHGRLPPGVRGRDLTFFRCPSCDQLYWRGSHVERILADLTAAGAHRRSHAGPGSGRSE